MHCCLPVVTYRAIALRIAKKFKKLWTMQHAVEGKMIGVTLRGGTRSQWITEQTGSLDLSQH